MKEWRKIDLQTTKIKTNKLVQQFVSGLDYTKDIEVCTLCSPNTKNNRKWYRERKPTYKSQLDQVTKGRRRKRIYPLK